jgi:tetratricopeptide (TPR) repeat protein
MDKFHSAKMTSRGNQIFKHSMTRQPTRRSSKYFKEVCAGLILLVLTTWCPVGAAAPNWAASNSHYSTTDANRLTQAFELVKKRRYEPAVRLFKTIGSYDILTYPAAQTVCETFTLSGEFKQALKIANELLARKENVSDPVKGVTVKLKADALAGLGEFDSAVTHYKTAAKLFPGSAYFILCHAAELLFKAHRYEETIKVADQALTFGSVNGLANMYKGASLLKLRRPAEAVKALNLSISRFEIIRKTKPDSFSIALSEDYRLVASAYKLEGKTDLAVVAEKKSNAFASSWDDTLFGSPDPSMHSGKTGRN